MVRIGCEIDTLYNNDGPKDRSLSLEVHLVPSCLSIVHVLAASTSSVEWTSMFHEFQSLPMYYLLILPCFRYEKGGVPMLDCRCQLVTHGQRDLGPVELSMSKFTGKHSIFEIGAWGDNHPTKKAQGLHLVLGGGLVVKMGP